ncbi:hypothetical protein AH06_201 [Erwinia phage AH06]|nr:hypothetical protein AH06_201 [Erwinia phage AH06]
MQQTATLSALLDHACRMGDVHLIIHVGELAATTVIPRRNARHSCIALLEFFERNKVLVQRALSHSGNAIDITLDDFQYEATIPGYDREHYLKTLIRRVNSLIVADDVTSQASESNGLYNPHAGFEKAAATVAQLLTSERRYAFVDHIGSVMGDGHILVRRSDIPSNVQNVTEVTDPRWLSMLVVNETTFERLPAGREVYTFAQATRLGDLINLLGEEGFTIEGISYPWVHIVRKTDVVRDERSVEWDKVAGEMHNAKGSSVRGLMFANKPTQSDDALAVISEAVLYPPQTIATSPLGTPASISAEGKALALAVGKAPSTPELMYLLSGTHRPESLVDHEENDE